MDKNNDAPALEPDGRLSLTLPAGAQGTNMFGDVFGGWVAAQIV